MSPEMIHLVIEAATTNRAAILYCFAEEAASAITVEQLRDSLIEEICPKCLSAYRSVNPTA
jgi:hypothetical protein